MGRRALAALFVASLTLGCGNQLLRWPGRSAPSGPGAATEAPPQAPPPAPTASTTGGTPASSSERPAPSRPTAAPAPAPPPVAVARPADASTALASRRTALLGDGERLGPDEVGYYMDVQEARLRQLVAEGLAVARRDSGLVVTIPGRLTFEVGSAKLVASGAPAIARLAQVLVEYRLSVVSLHGYTDSSGDPQTNLALSQARALDLARQFIAEGVAAKRIIAVGHGAEDPVADNATAEGRERNRRIEVRIDPLRP